MVNTVVHRDAGSRAFDAMYGDASYNKRDKRRAARPLLHAYSLRLAHPTVAEKPVHIVAPLPDDFAAVASAVTGVKEPEELAAWVQERVGAALAEGQQDFDELLSDMLSEQVAIEGDAN